MTRFPSWPIAVAGLLCATASPAVAIQSPPAAPAAQTGFDMRAAQLGGLLTGKLAFAS